MPNVGKDSDFERVEDTDNRDDDRCILWLHFMGSDF